MNMKKKRIYKRLLSLIIYIAVVTVTVIVAFPFVWLILTALKPYPEIYAYPILYWPRTITFEHFAYVLQLDFGRYFLNSVIIGVGTALASILVAILPAYASAKFRFPGRRGMLVSILVVQMFPQIVFVIPFFLILKALGLINSFAGLIAAYLPFTTPIAVWLIRNFFAEVPTELEEAAMIDGCSRMQSFRRIVLPLTIPGVAAVAIYSFLFAWSELMFALSFLSSPGKQTIPVFLSLFVGQYQTRWGPLFAGSVIASLPPIIVFGFMQKYFIRGLTSGSVKG